MDNTISFATPPVPNMKVYVPNYSKDMKQTMGDLIDKLISYGVLARLEDIGVVPELVSPSLITPKPDVGEWRLVTNFSGLNKSIKKYPSTSPMIADGKKYLARKKYFIHLDLSNFFFHSGVSAEDSQYLATLHPYKGLFCYVVDTELDVR